MLGIGCAWTGLGDVIVLCICICKCGGRCNFGCGATIGVDVLCCVSPDSAEVFVGVMACCGVGATTGCGDVKIIFLNLGRSRTYNPIMHAHIAIIIAI